VFTQLEHFDVGQARRLLGALPYRHRDLPLLGRMLKTAPGGKIKVQYRYGKGKTCGRVYGNAGAPTRNSRNMLCHELYVDLDGTYSQQKRTHTHTLLTSQLLTRTRLWSCKCLNGTARHVRA